MVDQTISRRQTAHPSSAKVYVQVNVDFRSDGVMLPREIIWEDGEIFEIDKVTKICQAAAMRAGKKATFSLNGVQIKPETI